MFDKRQNNGTLPVISILSRLGPIAALLILAACASTPREPAPPKTVPGYESVQDGEFFIEAVDERFLTADRQRSQVAYNGPDKPGTIVVDTHSRKLYYVQEDGTAMRYAIAVGREGRAFTGSGYIGRKAKWPSWTPTRNMIRTQPEMYAQYAGGLPGGLDNPLGSRALYLYRNGRDTYFRIHGTIDPASIGHATSAGCIRLFNQDAMDLYERVNTGAHVKVRSLAESIELEGPYMDDAWGRAVPDTPENRAQLEKDLLIVAKENEAKAQAAQEAALNGTDPAAIQG